MNLEALLLWINAVEPTSGRQPFSSLQAATTPAVLLGLLSRTVPTLGEPSLAATCLDEVGQLIVYCNACRRLGMRCLFTPADLLEANVSGPVDADRSGFDQVLSNLAELHAIFVARGSLNPVNIDYSQSLNMTAAHATVDPFVCLTYAEHEALYTGTLNVVIPAIGRLRLWQYLLCHEPDVLASSQSAGRAAARLAARRVSEARRRASSGAPHDIDALLHVLHSPGVGILLQRRKLLRSLVRAGVPPMARGYMWCMWAGLMEREAVGLLLPEDGGVPAMPPTSVKGGSCTVVTACRVCGARATVDAAFTPPCMHSLVPAVTPELCVPSNSHVPQLLLQLAQHQTHGTQSHDLPTPLSYYDRCVLANSASLMLRADGLPPRLAQVASYIGVRDGEWRGRRLPAAPPATVRQIDADLRRTTPHMWPIESSRVSATILSCRSTNQSRESSGYEVRYIYSARAQCWCRCTRLGRDIDRETTSSSDAGGREDPSCNCCNCKGSFAVVNARVQEPKQHWYSQATCNGFGAVLCPTAMSCQFGQLPMDSTGDVRLAPTLCRLAVNEAACRRVLLAFATHNPSVDYCQGLNFLVAHALRWCSEADAFALVTSLIHRILPPAYFDAALAGAARDQAVLAELLLSQAVPGLLTHLANLSGLISGPLRGHKLGTKSSVLEEERPSALGLGPPLSPLSSDGVHGPPKAFTTPRKGVIDITVVARRDELSDEEDVQRSGSSRLAETPDKLQRVQERLKPVPILPDSGALLQAAAALSGMTLKWFMCLFTLPFHAALTDRVWDSLLHEGVLPLSQSCITIPQQQQEKPCLPECEGIYWPTVPRRASHPTVTTNTAMDELRSYGLRIAATNPSGSCANKTLFKVALALLQLAAPGMLEAKTFGDALVVLEGLGALSAKPRVFSALFDVWAWPTGAPLLMQAASSGCEDALRPQSRHTEYVDQVDTSYVGARASDWRGSIDATRRPSDAASIATVYEGASQISPMPGASASVAAANALLDAQLRPSVKAGPRITRRGLRRGRQPPSSSPKGQDVSKIAVSESVERVSLSFGVDAHALEWMGNPAQSAVSLVTPSLSAGTKRVGLVGVGPAQSGNGVNSRHIRRATQLRMPKPGLRPAVQRPQPLTRDASSAAPDCSLDDAQVELYELPSTLAPAIAEAPSQKTEFAALGSAHAGTSLQAGTAVRQSTGSALAPARRVHQPAHWHLMTRGTRTNLSAQASQRNPGLGRDTPAASESRGARRSSVGTVAPQTATLGEDGAATTAGSVDLGILQPQQPPGSAQLLPSIAPTRALKPLVWREGVHVGRQWLQSRRAFLAEVAAHHAAAAAAVTAAIDASHEAGGDQPQKDSGAAANTALLYAAAIRPALDGGGGEHSPRCNLDLVEEAAAEESSLRAEAHRARGQVCSTEWPGVTDVHSAEKTDRSVHTSAAAAHAVCVVEVLGDECSMPEEDAPLAAPTTVEGGGPELSDIALDSTSDDPHARSDGDEDAAQSVGGSVSPLSPLANHEILHLHIGPEDAHSAASTLTPPAQVQTHPSATASPSRIPHARVEHVPPRCSSRSPSGPHGELCLTSRRLWAFYFREELDGSRPRIPLLGCRDDYFPSLHRAEQHAPLNASPVEEPHYQQQISVGSEARRAPPYAETAGGSSLMQGAGGGGRVGAVWLAALNLFSPPHHQPERIGDPHPPSSLDASAAGGGATSVDGIIEAARRPSSGSAVNVLLTEQQRTGGEEPVRRPLGAPALSPAHTSAVVRLQWQSGDSCSPNARSPPPAVDRVVAHMARESAAADEALCRPAAASPQDSSRRLPRAPPVLCCAADPEAGGGLVDSSGGGRTPPKECSLVGSQGPEMGLATGGPGGPGEPVPVSAASAAYAALPPRLLGHAVLPSYLLLASSGGAAPASPQ